MLGFAFDRAKHTKSPTVRVGIKGDGFVRNGHFGEPAIVGRCRVDVPDAGPVEVPPGHVFEDAVGANAIRVCLKQVASATIVEWADVQANFVFPPQVCPLDHSIRNNLARVAVVVHGSDVQEILVVQKPDNGLFRGFGVFDWVHLVQVIHDRGSVPDLVHFTVDDRRGVRPDHLQNFAAPRSFVDWRRLLCHRYATGDYQQGADWSAK